jgi:hypothetical protein
MSAEDAAINAAIAGEQGEEAEEDTTLANTEVTTKYQEAARIVNATLAEIVASVSLSTFLAICIFPSMLRMRSYFT